MIKSAIIGLGKMGISHCAIVNANPNVELKAVCDTSTFVLEAFKKYTDISCYTDYKKMFETEELDSVIVATPTKFHYPIVVEALNRGLHVFCEKPFSLTPEEGEKMAQLAKAKGVFNQVGYHNRFVGTFNKLKELIEDNILGNIYHFTGEAYGPVVTKPKSDTWRSKPGEGGGCLYDYASHVINLIHYILDTPSKVSGTMLKCVFSKEVEDTVYSSLTLENGLTGQLSVNWSDDTHRKMNTSITIYGTKGKIICDATELKIYLKEENKKHNLEDGWNTKYITDVTNPVDYYLRGEEYSSQMDYFFDSIKNNNVSSISSFENALETDKTINLLFTDSKNA